MTHFLLALGMPQGFEWLIIAAVGLLIFGKRLPEVGRSLGKGIVEFKKGLKGVEDDLEEGANKSGTTADQARSQITQETHTPPQFKFDPYTGKPIESSAPSSEPERIG